MAIYALGDRSPKIHPNAYISPEATIIGNVVIGDQASIWPNAVLRGDENRISIGAFTSVQDGAVIHCTDEWPTIVGEWCRIGHLAQLEGCRVDYHALSVSGSIVLHDAGIGSHGLVGGSAPVPGGQQVRACAMALGVPAKIREGAVSEGGNRDNAETYVARGHDYRANLRRIDGP